MLNLKRFAVLLSVAVLASLSMAQGKFVLKETYADETVCEGMDCDFQRGKCSVSLKGNADLNGFTFDHFDANTVFTLDVGGCTFSSALGDGDYTPGDTKVTFIEELTGIGSTKNLRLATVVVDWSKGVLKVKAKLNTQDEYARAYGDDFVDWTTGTYPFSSAMDIEFTPTAGPIWGLAKSGEPATAKVKRTEKTKDVVTTTRHKIKVSSVLE